MKLISMLSGARKGILIAMCILASSATHAAVTARDSITAAGFFAEAPLEVLDILRPSTRLDMLDYYNQADSILEAPDALGGTSRLVTVTPDYLKVQLTPVSTLEIKVLPYRKSKLVMTLYTAGGDDMAKDTDVRFFDSSMRPLDASKILRAPQLEDFFNLKKADFTAAQLKEKVPFVAIVYSSGPGEVPLTASLTTLGVISKEDRDMLEPLLIPLLTADWKSSFRFN